MKLSSLLLCSDDKIVRVLRRTLADLDINVEYCVDVDAALRHLTRSRFEAIIVDCADSGAADVLRRARTAPVNKRAIAVAILDPDTGLRSAFEQGAHFTLYKPVSAERARSSFRAARALMKRERRRNLRLPVNLVVEVVNAATDTRFKVNTIDIGEGGLALSLPKRSQPQGKWNLLFRLPGVADHVEISAEFAWQGTGTQVGLRFLDPSPEVQHQLREWLGRNSPDGEQDDPPVRCQLTDLSLRGCYLSVSSPFPVSTRITLSMKASGAEMRSEGIVRVMHPDKGMGVEFIQTTDEHRASLEAFLASLANNPKSVPELLVEPEGLESDNSLNSNINGSQDEDALLDLFRKHSTLGHEQFQALLRKQRGMTSAAAGV
ncbi:MAG: PilZ domain-containing protein [Candidatus Sulfotelmatobacter sp.]|jgi:ActR/RegA family two-component response regulator